MPWRSNEPGTDNWRHLWESNKKSHQRLARDWFRQLSSNPSPPVAPTVPIPTSDSSDTDAMTRKLVIQSPEDQFLHWCQDMEKKQEEQAKHIRELQDRTKCLQREKDRLRAQVEERRNLDERDSGQAKHSTIHNKGKKPIILDNIDTLADDELS